MLYNPKWKMNDLLSTLMFIEWLDKKPEDGIYNYTCTEGCLIAEYLRSKGIVDVWIPNDESWHVSFGPQQSLPKGWGEVAKAFPHTYGAAAERARKLMGN